MGSVCTLCLALYESLEWVVTVFSKIKYNLWVFLALVVFLLLPDVIYSHINSAYLASASWRNLMVACLIAFFLTFAKGKKLGVFFLVLFFLMQATQLAHYQYFGVFYSAFDIALMFKELRDTFTTVADIFGFLLKPLLLSMTFFALALTLYLSLYNKVKRIPYLSLVFIVALCVPFMQSLASKASQKFQPNVAEMAVKNSLYSTSYYLAREIKIALGVTKEMPSYQPYLVEKLAEKKANVVILMGESTSYLNFGTFGYHRDTTPDLAAYLDKPNFFQLPAISSAVSTRVSLALFYNMIYEPNNAAAISAMEHSFYRLAKQQGYQTYYITTQLNAGGLTYSFSVKDIDLWKENSDLSHYPGDYDNRLLLELKAQNIDFSKPNFITLHMRSAHGPYVKNYPREDAFFPDENVSETDYILNTYDNSIRYTQKQIVDIYRYFESIKEPVYIFFVPDHGETMGVDGRYGHNTVKLDSAQIPILFYGINVSEEETAAIKEKLGCLTNHYLVGKEIARLLGYRITNPNEQDDLYYMNGIDAFGEAGYTSYSLSKQREALCSNLQAIAR